MSNGDQRICYEKRLAATDPITEQAPRPPGFLCVEDRVDELPRDPAGKILKHRLRERFR